MKTVFKQTALVSLCASLIAVTGCTTTTGASNYDSTQLEQRTKELDEREALLNAREGNVSAEGTNSAASGSNLGGDLLPPNAAAGECYARVWVDAQYTTKTEDKIVAEESKKITVIPAQYETITETIEVSAASTRLETIPAVFGTEDETIKIHDGKRVWLTDLKRNASPASDALLATAQEYGIDLEAAQPGMCFHEHYLPATYKTVSDRIITKAATEEVSITPAQYEMAEETVLVKEASTRLVEVPAVYETVEEKFVDKPAYTVWKKGTGPIQRIDEGTGEIMCLVEVPATYKTVTRQVVKTPAQTQTIEIPAEYKTIKVRKLVAAASEDRTPVPAVYGEVTHEEVDQAGRLVWHEVHNTDHHKVTRTGNKICLTEVAPEYKTVTRTVVTTPVQTRTIEIPAEYKQVEVTKLVSAAREEVEVIPAKYQSVETRELVRDGYMAWRSILCETNMTAGRISDIQRALNDAGHNLTVDGVIGSSTIKAINAFQQANDLPVDKYLNIETIKALGVSTQ